MKTRILALSCLLSAIPAFQVSADPCAINTKRLKPTLSCINDKVNALEGNAALTIPDTVYQDEFVRVSVKGISRARTDDPKLFGASLSLRIKNISGQPVLVASRETISFSDETGQYCSGSQWEGIPIISTGSSESENSSKYAVIAPKSTRTINLFTANCYSFGYFKGSYFDISADFYRYDENQGTGIPFAIGLTGLYAPIK